MVRCQANSEGAAFSLSRRNGSIYALDPMQASLLRNFRCAFTLIELLVVIAIIAVLVSIALPVFNGIQKRARATQDANNLRQVGISLLVYLNDNDNSLPAATTWPGITNVPGLYPKYISTRKIFQSPFDGRASSETDTAPVSYGINVKMYATGTGGVDGNMASVVSPTSTILMAPAYTNDPENRTAWVGTATTPASLPVGGAGTKGTHANGGQINALFCDSHIESLKFGPSSAPGSFQDATSDPLGQKHWDPTK